MSTTCTAAAVITRPSSGLALDLPVRLLRQEFGQGRVVRFEEVDFPATLTHGPTRRFLRDTGLPEDGFLLHLDTEVSLPTLAEFYAEEQPDACPPPALPPRADRLIRLGRLVDGNSLLVDGTTGRVGLWDESRAAVSPLAKDVSVLTLTLWLLHRSLRARTPR
ncbi:MULTISPECIES: SUKH-4 family immunity protein [Streptomyces]|uniref:Uncharacterized protein n=1 Tax=Streptomyces thermogriseus TaxID=75292 RepID=A0ABP4DT60_9ACTN